MQPLAELRTPFELSRRELEAIDRGSRDYDLQVAIDAARQAASAEDAAVFHGYDAAGIAGISDSTPHARSEEHTSELQSRRDLVCRLLLEKKKTINLLIFAPDCL